MTAADVNLILGDDEDALSQPSAAPSAALGEGVAGVGTGVARNPPQLASIVLKPFQVRACMLLAPPFLLLLGGSDFPLMPCWL